MDFELTPEEAQSTARAVVDHFSAESHTVKIEAAVDKEVQFRPAVSATKHGMTTYVEAQSVPSYTPGVKELVHWMSVRRVNCEVLIAVPVDASLSGRFLTFLKRDGVGLMLVDEQGGVATHHPARNPALMITPDPTLKLGRLGAAVREAVRQFNEVDRKAALQTMCEIVEGETERLLKRLVRKAWIKKAEAQVTAMNWAAQIDVAAAKDVYTQGRNPLVDDKTKSDLHSFRGARNLIDHKTTSKKAERKRQSQFAERMLMGPRLAAELLALQRRVI